MKTLFCAIINLLFINICYSQWLQQLSGVTTPLYNVEFVNQNTGWATGSNSIILKTTNCGLNWFQQTIDLGYLKSLNGLDMLDANTGYIAGSFETILKTTNSGNNWIIISNIPSNQGNSNNGVSFINTSTGWVCSFLGRVLRTTNAGLNWDTSYVGTVGPLEDIQFLNSQTGWACGDVGTLIKSINGGINWSVSVFPTTSNLLSLHFINVNTGWCVSEQQNEVFRTTNGGIKWDTVAILPGGNNQYSYSIKFLNAQTGWVGGTYGRIFRTNNGGINWFNEDYNDLSGFVKNFSTIGDSVAYCVGGGGFMKRRNINNITLIQSDWETQTINTVSPLKDINMLDSLNGWAVGVNDTVYRTTNSGHNWLGVPTGSYYGFWSVFFVNNNTGWATGKEGLIIKTTNAGNNWINQSISIPDWVFSSYFISDLTGWVTFEQGVIRKTTNGGQNWFLQNSISNLNLYSIYFISPDKGWISCANGIIGVTTNSGANWIQQSTGTTMPLKDIFFINDTLGFCAGGTLQGIILKTINGGSNWTTIYQTTQKLNSINFISKDTGWAAGDSGTILFTSNSGVNWIKQNTGNYNNFYSVNFLNKRLGWIAGGYGTILRTTTGGNPIGIKQIGNNLPSKYFLHQNYPNPFNSQTIITFEIPSESEIEIKIYDILGKELKSPINKKLMPGIYQFQFHADGLSSGIFFYSLFARGKLIDTKKLILIK